jgi:SEL1 protein
MAITERHSGRRKTLAGHIGIAANASQSALTHWIRSAGQSNVDALVKVGDYYCESRCHRCPSMLTDSADDRIGVRSHEDPYEKAIGAYQSAADTQASAIAFWNLGWMYENGLGVPQVCPCYPSATSG